jgi:hypothetical protein
MYLDPRPEIKVRATVALVDTLRNMHTSRDGLRWRPNHNFEPPDGRAFYIGQVESSSGEAIQPGESREVGIRFIDGPGLRESLAPGHGWRLQEGPTLVAIAKVIEILGEI